MEHRESSLRERNSRSALERLQPQEKSNMTGVILYEYTKMTLEHPFLISSSGQGDFMVRQYICFVSGWQRV